MTSSEQHVYLDDLILKVGDDYDVSIIRSNIRSYMT